MSRTLHTPAPEDQRLLSQTLRDVARSRRLSPEDAQDFIQSAELKLLERNYDVFRRFDGRSSLRTYLTVVATRLLLDWRNSTYGKWRASAAAVSLGRVAVLLETLIVRDGHSRREAVAILLGRSDAPSKAELLRIAEQLPPRERRRMVSDESLFEIGARFEDPVRPRRATQGGATGPSRAGCSAAAATGRGSPAHQGALRSELLRPGARRRAEHRSQAALSAFRPRAADTASLARGRRRVRT